MLNPEHAERAAAMWETWYLGHTTDYHFGLASGQKTKEKAAAAAWYRGSGYQAAGGGPTEATGTPSASESEATSQPADQAEAADPVQAADCDAVEAESSAPIPTTEALPNGEPSTSTKENVQNQRTEGGQGVSNQEDAAKANRKHRATRPT